MSQNITPEKLEEFCKAVQKAAHDILGANGVLGVAVGLDRDTYFPARMEFMRSPMSMQASPAEIAHGWGRGFTFGYGYITVMPIADYGAFSSLVKMVAE